MTLAGTSVTVVGAGIGGLAVARALALRGAAVTVLEQAPELRTVGAGIQISPNGAVVLRALGLGEVLDAASLRNEAVELRDAASDRLVLRLDLAGLRPGQGYHLLHRAELIRILVAGARAAGVTILTDQRVRAAVLDGEVPRLMMADGTRQEASVLIGADGVHSRLREALNRVGPAEFSGQVAWRAVIPDSANAPPAAEVHMAPGRHLVSYPLPGGLRNLAGFEDRADAAPESWTGTADPKAFRRAFAGFGPRVRRWLQTVEDVRIWGLYRHPVAPVWQRGRTAILGDAAHPTLPYLAQGANMALEDAWVLAAMLDRHETVTAGLVAYQAARAARCTRIVAGSAANARAYHLHAPWRGPAHLGLRMAGTLAPGLALRRFDWLYGFDVTGDGK